MFIASQTLAFLTQPLTWVVALLVASLFMGGKPLVPGRRLVWAALALLLLLGWLPLPDLLIRRLERQHAEMPPEAGLKNYVGVVVLGGSTEPGYVADAHTQPLLTDAGERLTAPMAMLRHNPHLRVLYTGGGIAAFGSTSSSEAQLARRFYDSMGVPGSQVTYEAASRTTYDNAVLAAQLPGVDIRQPCLLLTSAWHMPRSMAAFTKEGWNVTAYPVDFRTGLATPWARYSLATGVRSWQLVLHELLGTLAYRLTGRL